MTWHLTLKHKIYYTAWSYWHMWMKRWFDPTRHHDHHGTCRPAWHLCCNGNAGGWRTRFCDYLEETWRELEAEENRRHDYR